MIRGDSYIGCQNEQQFKMLWLKRNHNPNTYFFCIETEETVKGFPDVMSVCREATKSIFVEFKFTKTGKIKFQPTQSSFYELKFTKTGKIKFQPTQPAFYEFKFTKTGKIKFQPTQPAFYKAHSDLNIWIVAYNAKTKTLHQFEKNELFKAGNVYEMNDKAEVDLNRAEVTL